MDSADLAAYGESLSYSNCSSSSLNTILLRCSPKKGLPGSLARGCLYPCGPETAFPCAFGRIVRSDAKRHENGLHEGLSGLNGKYFAGFGIVCDRDHNVALVGCVVVILVYKAHGVVELKPERPEQDEAEAAALAKKEAAAANKAIEAGEKTDVSKYSKFAATIVKNADGENTVTVTKGKNVKTAKINTITIGDKTYTVTRIGANAYKGMSKLTTVTTSNQVKVVGKAAFANCKKLTKVTLGKKVAKIGANAFKGDKKLAKIMIKSKKLTTKAKVGKNSFKGIKATAKFYIAKKAATYKKVKKAIKAQSGAPKKAKYVKKYA